MKKYISTFKKSAGFTLIELLVVIGILGILAAALVATIDPFEQINKGTDANVKNTVVEFVNGNIRYYTTHQDMPWNDVAAPATCATGDAVSGEALSTTRMQSCIDVLISDGELKESFATVQNTLERITVTEGANNVVIGCFLPLSKSQQRDPNTRFDSTGVEVTDPTTDCVGYGGSTQCYWCTR